MPTDLEIVNAGFDKVSQLELIYGDAIPAAAIREGFKYAGDNVQLENQVIGIFKPRQMEKGALSIKTTMPRGGGINIYNDQVNDDGFYHYSLQRGDPYGGNNKYLWQSLEFNQPFIYFHAVAPAIYKALWPCFIVNIEPEKRFALVSLGITEVTKKTEPNYKLPGEFESRYLVRESKARLHQSSFREAVLQAYNWRCAITGLAVTKLIEAAHIIPDQEIGEKQFLKNGIALSRIHHRAYDSDLIGIDADFKVHIGTELSSSPGNRFMESSFLRFDGQLLNLPSNIDAIPHKDYLARRFEKYELANK